MCVFPPFYTALMHKWIFQTCHRTYAQNTAAMLMLIGKIWKNSEYATKKKGFWKEKKTGNFHAKVMLFWCFWKLYTRSRTKRLTWSSPSISSTSQLYDGCVKSAVPFFANALNCHNSDCFDNNLDRKLVWRIFFYDLHYFLLARGLWKSKNRA